MRKNLHDIQFLEIRLDNRKTVFLDPSTIIFIEEEELEVIVDGEEEIIYRYSIKSNLKEDVFVGYSDASEHFHIWIGRGEDFRKEYFERIGERILLTYDHLIQIIKEKNQTYDKAFNRSDSEMQPTA